MKNPLKKHNSQQPGAHSPPLQVAEGRFSTNTARFVRAEHSATSQLDRAKATTHIKQFRTVDVPSAVAGLYETPTNVGQSVPILYSTCV